MKKEGQLDEAQFKTLLNKTESFLSVLKEEENGDVKVEEKTSLKEGDGTLIEGGVGLGGGQLESTLMINSMRESVSWEKIDKKGRPCASLNVNFTKLYDWFKANKERFHSS